MKERKMLKQKKYIDPIRYSQQAQIEGEIKKYNAFIRKCDDEIAKLEKKLIPDSVF